MKADAEKDQHTGAVSGVRAPPATVAALRRVDVSALVKTLDSFHFTLHDRGKASKGEGDSPGGFRDGDSGQRVHCGGQKCLVIEMKGGSKSGS